MTRHPTRLTLYIVFVCSLCWGFAYFSLNILHWRGWSLNVLLPLALSVGSTVLHGYPHDMPGRHLRNTAWLTLVVYAAGLLLMGWETLPWLLMAAPLLMLFTYIGFLLGLCYLRSRLRSELSMSLILLFLSVPVLNAWENMYKHPYNRAVTSQIEVAAAPAQVQQQLEQNQVSLQTIPGYLFADASQLYLVSAGNGRTMLTNTSLYRQSTAPAFYWNRVADQTLRLYQHYRLWQLREKIEHPVSQ